MWSGLQQGQTLPPSPSSAYESALSFRVTEILSACVYGHPKLGWPYTRTRRCQKYGHPKYEKPFEFKFKNFGWGYRSLAADTRGVVIQRAEQAGGDGGA